jgi:hypothetical protein
MNKTVTELEEMIDVQDALIKEKDKKIHWLIGAFRNAIEDLWKIHHTDPNTFSKEACEEYAELFDELDAK